MPQFRSHGLLIFGQRPPDDLVAALGALAQTMMEAGLTSIELGGTASFIVFEDADLDEAAEAPLQCQRHTNRPHTSAAPSNPVSAVKASPNQHQRAVWPQVFSKQFPGHGRLLTHCPQEVVRSSVYVRMLGTGTGL